MRIFLIVSTLITIFAIACTPTATPSNDAGDGGGSDAGTSDGSK